MPQVYHPFEYKGDPNTCHWCGRSLKRFPNRSVTGDHDFCSITCGYQFGREMAKRYHLMPKEERPAQPQQSAAIDVSAKVYQEHIDKLKRLYPHSLSESDIIRSLRQTFPEIADQETALEVYAHWLTH